jgi:glucose/mannose transport system substrate-binding protein
LLDSCTVDGRVYCVPMNIHSAQWLWVSHGAFETAGLPVPTNWDEFVAGSAKLQEAGIVPLVMGQQGWQQSIAFGALTLGIVGVDSFLDVTANKNAEEAAGEAWTRAFVAVAEARELARESNVQDWNLATNMVIQDTAGGQIMGDWAQGEFQVAGEVAGEDYSCLPGMGFNEILDTGGDAFYFPVIDDPAVQAAQMDLASLLISKEMQVDFNLAKGSLPVRGDIDLSAANACMQKGLQILADGGIMPSNRQTFDADTDQQINDLMSEFWATEMSPAEAQSAYVSIIENAL